MQTQTDQRRDGETDKPTERAHSRLVDIRSNQPTDSKTDPLSPLSDQSNSPRSARCPFNRPTNQQLKRDIGSLDPSMANMLIHGTIYLPFSLFYKSDSMIDSVFVQRPCRG